MSSGFAYAQARVQARFAGLLEDSAWQRLEATRGLSGLLEEVRHTPMEHWVSGLSKLSDARHLERTLQQGLLLVLAEALDWLPKPWRAAAAWTAWLPLLPRLQTGKPPPEWMSATVPGLIGRENGPPSSLTQADAAALSRIWLEHWRSLWPACGKRDLAGMELLVSLARDHQARFPDISADQGWGERRRFAQSLHRLFRRSALQPAAVFTWLGLEALEAERLRGALVRRALFTPAGDL